MNTTNNTGQKSFMKKLGEFIVFGFFIALFLGFLGLIFGGPVGFAVGIKLSFAISFGAAFGVAPADSNMS